MTFIFHDAQVSRSWYLELHSRLSYLQEYLARQAIPETYDTKDCKTVAQTMQLIEALVEELSNNL